MVKQKSYPTAKQKILEIEKYVPGKHHLNGREAIVLSANENPLGCSDSVKNIFSHIKTSEYNRYPDSSYLNLRKKIAHIHNIDDYENIVLGAGSDEVLNLLINAYSASGDEVIYTEHGFLIYKIAALIAGATPVMAKEENYKVSVENILNSITEKTKIICIANPANPTGTMLTKSEVDTLIANTPSNVLIILDNAYAEYVSDDEYYDTIPLVAKYKNVVMTRTFSKIYGIASFRVGWCYSSHEIADIINRTRCPFNLSTISEIAATLAVEDQDFVQMSKHHNTKQKQILMTALNQIKNVHAIESHTNFILVELKDEKTAIKVYNELEKNGIITRLVKAYNLPHCIRLTIGKEDENKKLISVFKGLNL